MAASTPPFAVPSSLVTSEPGQAERGVERAHLRQCVLTGVAIDHQQHLVRRLRVGFGDRALHLLQLFHQVQLCWQAAGGVGNHHVAAARADRRHTASKVTAAGSPPC